MHIQRVHGPRSPLSCVWSSGVALFPISMTDTAWEQSKFHEVMVLGFERLEARIASCDHQRPAFDLQVHWIEMLGKYSILWVPVQ